MARIVICHIPADAAAARELGAALMSRSNAVSFDAEADGERSGRMNWLVEFDAVAVLWTELSATSPGLARIAEHMLPRNKLVPVHAEGLVSSRLPLAFRKLRAFALKEGDGIAKFAARLAATAAQTKAMQAAPDPRATSTSPAQPAHAPVARDERPAGTSTERYLAAQAPLRKPPDPATPVTAPRPASEPAPPAPKAPATAPEPVPIVSPVALASEVPNRQSIARWLPEVTAADDPFEGLSAAARALIAPAAHVATEARGYSVVRQELAPAPSPAALPADLYNRPNATQVLELLADQLIGSVTGEITVGVGTAIEFHLGSSAMFEIAREASGYNWDETVPVLETMTLSLYARSGTFEIGRQSDPTQSVASITGALAVDGHGGRWSWIVTGYESGHHALVLRISGRLRDATGETVSASIGERQFPVSVRDQIQDAPGLRGLVSRLSRIG